MRVLLADKRNEVLSFLGGFVFGVSSVGVYEFIVQSQIGLVWQVLIGTVTGAFLSYVTSLRNGSKIF